MMTRWTISITGSIIPGRGTPIGVFCHIMQAINSQYDETNVANPTRIARSFRRFL